MKQVRGGITLIENNMPTTFNEKLIMLIFTNFVCNIKLCNDINLYHVTITC